MNLDERRRLSDRAEDPEAIRVQETLRPLLEPRVPPGAKARVRAQLSASRRRGPVGWGAAVAVAVVALLGLAIGVSRRPAPAAAPAPVVAGAPATWQAPEDRPRALTLDLGTFELAPGSHLIRGAALPELSLARGAVKVSGLSRAVTLVAGRYSVRLEAGAEARLAASPFAIYVRRGAARLEGPEGARALRASDSWPPEQEVEVAPPPTPTKASTPPKAKASPPKVAPALPPGGPRAASAPTDLGAVYRAARSEPDPDRAVKAFDRVLAAGGPWAEMAGHQAVRRRVGQRRFVEALSRLDTLEARFEGGAHAPEVWLARIEIRVAQDDLRSARPDLDRYLARLPESLRAGELFFLRGELHRAQGDLPRAAADYRRVARGPYLEAARVALEKIEEEVKAPGGSAHP